MRSLAVLLLMLGLAAPASAADLMVVGRTGTVLSPRAASLKGAGVRVDGHRCRVAGRTALAALARTRLKLGLRDYGACSRRPSDATGLYVRKVAGQAERGADGWVYKLGNSAPSIGAADVSGRFGKRTRVLWFWCRNGPTGCQRTLTAAPAQRAVARGQTLRVRVRAFDDLGRAVAGAGATVTMGSASAVANRRGVAQITVPGTRGRVDVVATHSGRVRSFPVQVRVR